MEKISQKTQDFIDGIRYEIRYPSIFPSKALTSKEMNIVTKAIFENANSDVYVFATGLDDYIFSEEMEDTIYNFSKGQKKLKILFKQDIEKSSLPKTFQDMIFWRQLKFFCGAENFLYKRKIDNKIFTGYPILCGFMCIERVIAEDGEEYGVYNFRFQEKEREMFIDFYKIIKTSKTMLDFEKSKNPSHV